MAADGKGSARRQVIVDCDPGIDDALAILLTARHLDVLGITPVGGNQSLDKVTRNALQVLELGGLDHIPVIPGFDRPLVAEPSYAVSHGESGLGEVTLPEPSRPVHPGHAVDFIIESVLAGNGVSLIAIGPLTNVAAALRREPRVVSHLPGICLMGGSATFGNSTATAEFNIWCDPEAAHIVFSSGVPINMAGLNLTHQALARTAEIERIRALGNRTGQTVTDLLLFHREQYRAQRGIDGAVMHDACAVAWLIAPSLITSYPLHVAIELYGEHTRGTTVCDYRQLLGPYGDIGSVQGHRRGLPPNAEVGWDLDAPRFFDLLIDALAEYP